jgi:hypothetical protein
LTANGYEVIAAAEGAQAHLLQTEFPSLQILPLAGYRVRYSRSKWGLAFTLWRSCHVYEGLLKKNINGWIRSSMINTYRSRDL